MSVPLEQSCFETVTRMTDENVRMKLYLHEMIDVLSDVDLSFHGNAQELYNEVCKFLGRDTSDSDY